MEQLQGILGGPSGPILFIVVLVLAIVFLVLWLKGGKGGGSDANVEGELKAAQSQLKLARGDLMAANKELESLKAVAGGKMPPEFEQYKRRAEEADAQIRTLKEAHEKEVEALKEMIPEDDSLGQTMIAPSTANMHEEIESLRAALADTQKQLDEVGSTHQQALNDLTSKLTAEKAAALTAMEQRHAAAIEALRKQAGLSEGVVASTVAAMAAGAGAAAAPDPAALPYLEVMTGEQKGSRIVLPFATSTIGRSDTASIPVDEPRASRNHAEIRFDGKGFAVQDMNSTNGTIVNGTPISTVGLAFGDTIAIGDLELRFSCAAADAGDPAEARRLYEAMLQTAPGFEAASQGLGGVQG